MAARSPSPNPSRPTSSRPKTPEMRRSGSFNLSKPSSNEEIHWRSSGSKAGRDLQPSLRSSFEQKENNEAKTPRPRSPAVSSSSKGAVKSFMAPTFSAASKAIAAASPRKKILGERNEVISVSASLEFPHREEIGARALPGSTESQSVSWPDFGEILGGAESRNAVVEPEIKNKKHVDVPSDVVEPEIKVQKHVVVPAFTPSPVIASPVIASLDVDPSPNRPYDPKTNYLSPRPRFLCYRPNPRFEQFKERGFLDVGDGKNLEDSLSFESYEEEQQSLECEEESSFAEVVVEEAIDEPPASEPELQPKPITNHSKSRPSMRLKSATFLLVLVIACLYTPLSDSPVISSSPLTIKTRSFVTSALPVLHSEYLKDYITLANVHFNELGNRLRHWSIDTIGYLSSTTSHPPSNLTSSDVDQSQTVGADFIYSSTAPNQGRPEIEADQSIDEIVVHEESHFEHVTMEVSEDTKQNDLDSLESEEDGDENEWEKMVAEVPHDDGTEAVEEDIHQVDDMTDDDSMEEVEQKESTSSHEVLNSEAEIKGEEVGISHEPEISEYEETPIEPIGSDDNLLQETVIEPVGSGDNLSDYSEDSLEHLVVNSEENLSRNVLGVSLAVTFLAATMIVAYMKKKQATLVIANECLSPKSVSGSSERCRHAKGSPSQNFLVGMEVVGDTGPSEASSSLHSSSSFRRQRTTKRSKGEEALSNERRTRRDSTVSSSVSYGSFTTYEKLSAKEGYGDEDVGTPVRRSSRLRNQIISP